MYGTVRLLARRREKKRLAYALLFGDAKWGIPALQPWRKEVDDKLDAHSDLLTAIIKEHRPNGGTSSWDGLSVLDKNVRILAAALGAKLDDEKPLAERKKPLTPVAAPHSEEQEPTE